MEKRAKIWNLGFRASVPHLVHAKLESRSESEKEEKEKRFGLGSCYASIEDKVAANMSCSYHTSRAFNSRKTLIDYLVERDPAKPWHKASE